MILKMTNPIEASERRPKIAQRFKRWVNVVFMSSSAGTKEFLQRFNASDFFRPCGACSFLKSQPTVETVGYIHLSLRDEIPYEQNYHRLQRQ